MRPARRIRVAKGWSIITLAGIARTTPDQVKRLELGDAAGMPVRVLVRIAAALGVTPLDLMPGLRRAGIHAWENVTRIADAMDAADGQPAGARPPTARVRNAMRWTRERLAAGPVPCSAIRTESAAAGHTWGSMRRALVRLNVHRTVDGFGQPQRYSLPEGDPDPHEPERRLREIAEKSSDFRQETV